MTIDDAYNCINEDNKYDTIRVEEPDLFAYRPLPLKPPPYPTRPPPPNPTPPEGHASPPPPQPGPPPPPLPPSFPPPPHPPYYDFSGALATRAAQLLARTVAPIGKKWRPSPPAASSSSQRRLRRRELGGDSSQAGANQTATGSGAAGGDSGQEVEVEEETVVPSTEEAKRILRESSYDSSGRSRCHSFNYTGTALDASRCVCCVVKLLLPTLSHVVWPSNDRRSPACFPSQVRRGEAAPSFQRPPAYAEPERRPLSAGHASGGCLMEVIRGTHTLMEPLVERPK